MNDIKIEQLEINDINNYFKAITNIDDESRYFTKTLENFSFQEIEKYIKKVVNDSSRFDFLIKNTNSSSH